jgi:hypothetical protein
MLQQPNNDNQQTAQATAPVAAPTSTVLRFVRVPTADRVTLYWPIARDTEARDVLRDVGAVRVGIDSQPASSATRREFGHSHTGRAIVTFAAFARIVAAGHADPIHRA